MIYLYTKEHNQTTLKYFGKTIQDPYKYKGSGVRWTNHLKKHGNDVTTTNVWSFNNKEECSAFALKFSVDQNIANDPSWANLKEETGLDGGGTYSKESRQRMSLAKKGKAGHPLTQEQKEKLRLSKLGKPKSEEHKAKISKKLTGRIGKKHSEESKAKMRKPKNYIRTDVHRSKLSKSMLGQVKAVTPEGVCITTTREEFYSNPSLVGHRSLEGRKRLETNSRAN